MRAIVTHEGKLSEEDIPAPEPGEGQVLLKSLVCGICGTDLHARHHLPHLIESSARAGVPLPTDPYGPVVFGHEFCGEVLDHGPGGEGKISAGAHVVALPYAIGPEGFEFIGYSNRFPGALAERFVVTEQMMMEVPNGLSPEIAALTEPVAVGAHAVTRAAIDEPAVTIVFGCGPIGLAVIAALKARGIGPVIGADLVAEQREQAVRMGADEIFDPATEEAVSVWSRHGAGMEGPRAIAFECVGLPGLVQEIVEAIPHKGRVIGVGNAMEPCAIDQVLAFNKELDIRFSMTYSAEEFAVTLRDLAEGRIDGEAMTGRIVDLSEAPAAFDELEKGAASGKLLIRTG